MSTIPVSMSGSARSGGSSLTSLLQAWRGGDGAAYERVFDQAYAELKQIAARRLGAGSSRATLSPTELVHEAALRVLGTDMQWENRAHFFASMSLYMRAVLIDHARSRMSGKRGGGHVHVTLGHAEVGAESGIAELLALDAALIQLEAHDPRSSAVMHLTYFSGLDRHDIAGVLNVSVQIVDRELRFAKTWLNAHLESPL
ncbi:MAG: ECF-type sigma factor [Tahibacter sp.]